MPAEQEKPQEQAQPGTQDESQPGTGRSPSVLIAVIVAVAVLALIAAFMLWPSDDASEPAAEAPVAPVATEEAADEFETLRVPVGDPAAAGPFVVTVTEAGRTTIEVAETPPEGTSYYVVGVTFENTGPTVPINGQPYSVDGTILESSSGTHEGIMQVPFGQDTSEGTIPKGSTLVLNFVFTVPDEADDFVFVWTPMTSEFPRILVPLEE